MNQRVYALVTTLLLVTLSASVVLADVLVFKDGRQLEGTVVEETDAWVRIKTRFGTQKIDRSQIREILKGRTKEQEYSERRKALALDDLEGHVALALWCKDQKMLREAKEVWQMVLVIDPTHEAARRELGHIRYKDRWYTPEELEKVKEAEFREKGYVEYEGEWVPADHAEKMKRGLRLHEGKWMTVEEIQRAKGFVEVDGKWVSPDEKVCLEARLEVEDALGLTPRTVLTENFLFVSMLSEERTRELAEKAENAIRYIFEFLDGDPTVKPWPGRGRYYMFDNRNNYEDFITYILPDYGQDEDFVKMLLESGGGPNLSGLKTRHQGLPLAADYDRESLPWDNSIYHKVAGYCLENYTGRAPFWLLEGFAAFVEFHFTDASRIVSITNTSYGDRADLADKATDSKFWRELLKDAVLHDEDTRFIEFKNKKLNQLDYMDLSKSWSLITFFAETRKDAFVAFLRNLRSNNQDDALVEAMGKGHEEVDEEWRAWVREKY
jgi:hypothetical protein